jgi:hypothetical protein
MGLQKMRENFDYDSEPDIVEAANVFLEKHHELLPKLVDDENEIAWAPEALEYLGRDHKPKNRIIPHVHVVPRRQLIPIDSIVSLNQFLQKT